MASCFLIALFFLAPYAHADGTADLSQTEAQIYATQVNQAGSDQSLQNSATSAMQAIMFFGDGDVKGAITNAYRAYGSFKNSENLDRVHKQALLDKAALASAGTNNLTAQETSFLSSVTSFRRLNPSFLTGGDTASVADDFEKKTGIKRQDFLDTLSSLSENRLYVSDPNLAEKVDAQVDGFLAKIPNADFKAKVNSALSLLPSLSRHKLMVEAVQNMVNLAGKFGSPSATPPTVVAKTAVESTKREPAAVMDAKSTDTATEAEDAMVNSLTGDAMAKSNDDGNSHKLDGVIKAAIHDDPESETLFEKISRRYRMLTSDLVPPKEVKPTKE